MAFSRTSSGNPALLSIFWNLLGGARSASSWAVKVYCLSARLGLMTVMGLVVWVACVRGIEGNTERDAGEQQGP
ncbi:hypothetical protein HYQ46_003090 [Verticillium longisporum]|nr:hypothetical protein HYQ46_003090 [Verticillium longisporum]